MSMTVVPIELIGVDDRRRACILGTSLRVSQIARDVHDGMRVSDLLEAYPDLKPQQVHAAMAYYYEHEAEVLAEIGAEDAATDRSRAAHVAGAHTADSLRSRPAR